MGGGNCKPGTKTSARLRQHRDEGSWSDDGTAYQDDLNSDVELSDDDQGADWAGADDDEDESWGQRVTTPKLSRYDYCMVTRFWLVVLGAVNARDTVVLQYMHA